METKEFTIEEMLQAAERATLPNYNGTFITYNEDDGVHPVEACVIGEAFLNLGFAENGIDAGHLSDVLAEIPIEIPLIKEYTKVKRIYLGHEHMLSPESINNLSRFINELNGIKGYSGKKRIPKLVRKHFPKSLGIRIRATEDGFEIIS